MAKAKRD